MSQYCNDIDQYVVRIDTPKEKGSGVLVKPNDNAKNGYVFTAKHTLTKAFEKFEYPKHQGEIKIFQNNQKEILEIYHKDLFIIDEQLDLAIFILDSNIEDNKGILNQLDVLKIFNDEFSTCISAGYPTVRKIEDQKDYETDCYICHYNKIHDNCSYKYEIRTERILFCPDKSQKENMEGFSGSGVFVHGQDKKYYLSGIVIQSRNQQILICLDLTALFERIKNYLVDRKEIPIQIDGFSPSKALGIENTTLQLDQIKAEINDNLPLIKDIKSYERFEQQIDYIKTGGEFNKKLKKRVEALDKELEEISLTYLYQAILFDENKEHQKATHNFKKSIKYRDDFKAYFYKAKASRKRQDSHNDIKEKQEQREIHEYLLKTEEVRENANKRLESLKELLPVYQDKKDDEKLETTYLALLDIYAKEENNHLFIEEKANIYYQLGEIYFNRKKYEEAKELLTNDLETNDNKLKRKIKVKLALTYFEIAKIYEGKKDIDKMISSLQEAEKQLYGENNILNGKIYLYFVKVFLNKKEWHETDKYLNRALKIYQHLKMDNAIYLKEIIWIYSALAKTNRYLEQDNYMNSEIFFEKALDEISHLDKNADEYKRYQHIIQKQRQIYFDEKQQNVFTNINNDLKQIQRVLKQQAELQQKNTTQIQALYCLLNQKQKANKNKLTMLIETIKKLF
jgi:tetratricopeptide (TPR) repeat protein